MAKKRYYEDPLRRREYEDSMMIREDRNAIANLPQEVKYVEYPKEPYYNGPKLNDTISGVDKQIWDDVSAPALKKNGYPEKF